jgi:hypothetical protein
MSKKILCTMKSIKQQIYYFFHDLCSKQTLYKNYHMHVLYKVCSLAKITKISHNSHLNYTSIFFYRTSITYIFHTKCIT